MTLHDGLLEQAQHLLRREKRRPKQASLRRAISTAYYALFHLLTFDAARVLIGFIKDQALQARIQRSFAHRQLKDVSRAFTFQAKSGKSPSPRLPSEIDDFVNAIADPPRDLIRVASALVQLFEARQQADYHTDHQYTRDEAAERVDSAVEAFHAWDRVKSDPLARVYLVSMLLTTKWDVKRDL
jgi:uncharacterized protein (UPF0332 family)